MMGNAKAWRWDKRTRLPRLFCFQYIFNNGSLNRECEGTTSKLHFIMSWFNKFRKIGLVAIFLVFAIPVLAYTDGEYITFGDINYQVISASKHTLRVMGGKPDSNGNLEIPAKVFDGKDVTFTVTTLGGDGSKSYKGVKSITIPEGITTIGPYFLTGSTVQTVTIPSTVTTIPSSLWGIDSFPKFTVADGNSFFESDDDGALYSKGRSMLYMVPSALSPADGVYNIDSNVKTTSYMFRNNTNIKKVVVPASVTNIVTGWPSIDAYCTNLTVYEVDAENLNYQAIDGMLCTKGDTVSLIKAPYGKLYTGTYTMPDGIKTLTTYSFYARGINRPKGDCPWQADAAA